MHRMANLTADARTVRGVVVQYLPLEQRAGWRRVVLSAGGGAPRAVASGDGGGGGGRNREPEAACGSVGRVDPPALPAASPPTGPAQWPPTRLLVTERIFQDWPRESLIVSQLVNRL